MTEIILFQPKCGIWDIMGVRPPTGLLNIASVPVNEGYDVKLIDQRINQNWKKELKKDIDSGVKIVCLTSMVGEQIKYMIEVSELVKSLNPKVLVVLGGSWAQTCPEICMQNKNIDIVCCGEGDFLLTDLMKFCKGRLKIENVKGIFYRTKGRGIKKTEPRPLIKNLDSLPKIPYHLINLKDYSSIGLSKDRLSMALVLSRGCPYRCAFCSIVPLYKRTWRHYSIERIMEDLTELETKYGIKDFFFMDDNIATDLKFFFELADAFIKAKKDYNWGAAGIRADTIINFNEKDFEKLIKSGCKNLDVGIESGNQRVLDFIKKDTKLELIEKANKKLSKYPIIVKYTFMGGFPTETEEEFLDTLKFRKKIQKDNPYVVTPIFFYTPFPGTELFEIAMENGFKPPKTLIGWADFNYNTWYRLYPSWLTKKKINLIENSMFISYFADEKLSYKYPNKLMNLMFSIYCPIAKFRQDNNFYYFMVEKNLSNFVAKLNEKFNLFNRFKKK